MKRPSRKELVTALQELQSAIGDETLRGGERVRAREGRRLAAPRINGAIVTAKDVLRREVWSTKSGNLAWAIKHHGVLATVDAVRGPEEQDIEAVRPGGARPWRSGPLNPPYSQHRRSNRT